MLHFLRRPFPAIAVLMGLLACTGAAHAGRGKLLLTGGVSNVEGAAGGGLTPWAVTGSYATEGEVGGTAFVTGAKTRNYSLAAYGMAVGIHDRIELSIARQEFDAKDNLAPLGLTRLRLGQDILGIKLRVAGDAVLDSDTLLPQVAVGLQHKKVDAGALGPTLFGPLGAKDSGTDVYVSATKLFLAHGLLVNVTLRATRANQTGLLGFGGAHAQRRKLQPEISVARLLSPRVAVGAEFRAKPDNLSRSVLGAGALKESPWWDVFVAWAPTKDVSMTAAFVDLGKIAPALQPRRQTGAYLSVQLAF